MNIKMKSLTIKKCFVLLLTTPNQKNHLDNHPTLNYEG